MNHEDVISSTLGPIFLDGIIFRDEHHRQVILGNAGACLYIFSRNNDGVITAPSKSGIFTEEKDRATIKYPGGGRGCFGAAFVTRNGVEEGVRVVLYGAESNI